MIRKPEHNKFRKEKQFSSINMTDAEAQEKYDKETRFGLDDPLPMKTLDVRLRCDLLHVVLQAYDIPPEEFVLFLKLMYPRL